MQTRLLALLLLLNTAAEAQICFGGCPGGGSTVEEEEVDPVPDCTTPHGRPGRCGAVNHSMEDNKLVWN